MTKRFDSDIEHIGQLAEASGSSYRLDANETVFFARQLEFIRSKVFDTKRPPMSALEVFPIDTSVPEWAETVTYRMYDATGVAKIIANYADDLPFVGVQGKEFSSSIKSLGDAYGWSVQELRAAAATGYPLKSNKAVMAKRAHDIAVNQIAWFGDANANLPGLLTNANIPAYTVPADGTGSSKLWTTKTADQIIRDMTGIVNTVFTQSKGVHKATELWLPNANFVLVNSTVRGTTANPSPDSILAVFLKNNPGVRVRNLLELENVAALSNLNVMVAAENSLENYQLILPMVFKEYPPEAQNLAWKVLCESRVGGVVIEYPLAFAIGTGI